MIQQHYRLTLEKALAHYQKGWITATALLYYYLVILKLINEPIFSR